MFRYFGVFLCLCACWSLATAYSRRRYGYGSKPSYGTCGAARGITHVSFPDLRKLLTLDEFEEYVVGKKSTEVFVAVERPSKFPPDLAYMTMITEIADSTSYMQVSEGITDSDTPKCSRREYTLTPLSPLSRAYFDRDATVNGADSTLAMWSSCPSSYIIFIRCKDGDLVQGRCPIGSTTIVFQAQGDSLDDFLWDAMLNDLCDGTGIKFGQKDFEWIFTYDTDDICNMPTPGPVSNPPEL